METCLRKSPGSQIDEVKEKVSILEFQKRSQQCLKLSAIKR